MSVVIEIAKIAGIIIATIPLSVIAKVLFALSAVDTFTIFGSMATIVIAVCAVMGLFTWRKQRDYELAIRLLVSIRKYQDTMRDFADPFMSIGSIIHLWLPPEDELNHTEKRKRFEEREKIEYKRHNKVVSARQEFYDDVLRSEVLWGEEIKSIVGEMREIEYTFRQKITHELTTKDPDVEPDEKNDTKQYLETMQSDDELLEEFNKLVKKAEDYLKPKISLQNPNPPTQSNPKENTK